VDSLGHHRDGGDRASEADVTPDKVYTRKGDDGTTQLLFSGKERVSKSSLRVNAYGDCDEAVSVLGIARAEATVDGQDDVAEIVLRLQRELFVVGAELATDPSNRERLTPGVSLVTPELASAHETLIDDLTERFEQPKDFIVPGNSKLGAALDHAARVVRRAERSVDALASVDDVRSEVRSYLNRLADLVWVLARYAEREERQPRPRSG
jgi:cob(I)alamin adenosyltransferase